MTLARELIIETPEGIRFSYALAGPIIRCVAWLIDLAAFVVLVAVTATVISVLGLLSPNLMGAILLVALFLLYFGYGAVLEWFWRGQTLGKRWLGLRVMDQHGFRLRFYQVLLRNLLRVADGLPAFYFVGGLSALLSARGQRLGDLAAGTVVVRHVRPFEPDFEQLLAGKFNSLRAVPHLAARLRQRISPEEASLALQALLRREDFAEDARLALFGRLAAHFRALVPFPAEVDELLADEPYVRNVADLLFRTDAAPPPAGPVPI